MISIIIPALNMLDMTKRLVYSIKSYTQDVEYELICVDDGSTDGTYEYFKTITDKVVHSDTRKGVAYSYNKGLELAHKNSEFITGICNDMFAGPRWLSSLVNTYRDLVRKGVRVWCVSSKVVCGTESSFSEVAFFQESNTFMNAVPYQINFVGIGTELFPSVIPKSLIDQYGFFDPDFYNGVFWEDVDMQYRYRRAGYVPYCSPNSRVFHFGPSTTALKLVDIHQLNYINKTTFERKWGIR